MNIKVKNYLSKSYDLDSFFQRWLVDYFQFITQRLSQSLHIKNERLKSGLLRRFIQKNYFPQRKYLLTLHRENREIDFSDIHISIFNVELLKQLIIYKLKLCFSLIYTLIIPSIENSKNKIVIADLNINQFPSTDQFQEQINSIERNDYILIAKGDNKKVSSTLYTSKFPILDSLRFCNLSLLDKFKILNLIFLKQVEFVLLAFKNPNFLTFSNDFISYPLVSYLDSLNLEISLLRTNSEFEDQEFWFENLKHIKYKTLWYSLNCRPFQFKFQSRILENQTYHSYYYSFLGENITWDESHVDWLKNTWGDNVQYKLVKPLIFYTKNKLEKTANKAIVIFDVTPTNPSFMAENFLSGELYYSFETCSRFLMDILSVAKLLNQKVYLKHKRRYVAIHDTRYIEFVKKLANEGDLILLEDDTDILQLISQSKVTISIPFTSTGVLSNILGRHTIYYDSTQKIVASDLEKQFFVDSPALLESKLKEIFSA